MHARAVSRRLLKRLAFMRPGQRHAGWWLGGISMGISSSSPTIVYCESNYVICFCTPCEALVQHRTQNNAKTGTVFKAYVAMS
jgi:hypothetical protein